MSGCARQVGRPSGWRCKACDEIESDAESARRYVKGRRGTVIETTSASRRSSTHRQKTRSQPAGGRASHRRWPKHFSRYERGAARLPAGEPVPAARSASVSCWGEIMPERGQSGGREPSLLLWAIGWVRPRYETARIASAKTGTRSLIAIDFAENGLSARFR